MTITTALRQDGVGAGSGDKLEEIGLRLSVSLEYPSPGRDRLESIDLDVDICCRTLRVDGVWLSSHRVVYQRVQDHAS